MVMEIEAMELKEVGVLIPYQLHLVMTNHLEVTLGFILLILKEQVMNLLI